MYMNFSFSFYSTVTAHMFEMYYLWFLEWQCKFSFTCCDMDLMSFPAAHLCLCHCSLLCIWFHYTQTIIQKCSGKLKSVFYHTPEDLRPLLPDRCENQHICDIWKECEIILYWASSMIYEKSDYFVLSVRCDLQTPLLHTCTDAFEVFYKLLKMLMTTKCPRHTLKSLLLRAYVWMWITIISTYTHTLMKCVQWNLKHVNRS